MTGSELLSRTALFVNGASRTGARAYGPTREAMIARGVNLLRCEAVKEPAALPKAVRRAAADGCRLIVIGGGDGSIGPAAGILADLPVDERPVLGVIPLGTANDFARTLEIPARIDAAVDVLVTGKVVDIDLGRANGHPYVNVASLGLSVGSTRALHPALKKALGPASYPVSTVVAYRRHHPFTLHLDFPDGDHESRELVDLLQVSIGNGQYYGGGQKIAPNAQIDDHLLDVYLIKTGKLRDHLSMRRLVRDGTIIDHDDVVHLTTRALRLRAETEQPVNLDGELVTSTPVDLRVDRNAFEVLVPKHLTNVRHDSAQRDDEGNTRPTSDS
jgi:diacylglycerol kinase (ATP)